MQKSTSKMIIDRNMIFYFVSSSFKEGTTATCIHSRFSYLKFNKSHNLSHTNKSASNSDIQFQWMKKKSIENPYQIIFKCDLNSSNRSNTLYIKPYIQLIKKNVVFIFCSVIKVSTVWLFAFTRMYGIHVYHAIESIRTMENYAI